MICLQTHFKAINSYIYISWMCLLFQDLAQTSESDMTKQHCMEPKKRIKSNWTIIDAVSGKLSLFLIILIMQLICYIKEGSWRGIPPSKLNNRLVWLSDIWTSPRACMAQQSPREMVTLRKPCPAGHLEVWEAPKTNGWCFRKVRGDTSGTLNCGK